MKAVFRKKYSDFSAFSIKNRQMIRQKYCVDVKFSNFDNCMVVL